MDMLKRARIPSVNPTTLMALATPLVWLGVALIVAEKPSRVRA